MDANIETNDGRLKAILESNDKIVELLNECISPEEQSAVMHDRGRLITSLNPYVISVLKKMHDLKPETRIVLDLASQQYIMCKLRRKIAIGRQSPQPEEKTTDAQNNEKLNALIGIFYNGMDENNKQAADVINKNGAEEGVKYMFQSAGGDYARMRAMYG